MIIVVSDASPITNLIKIGELQLLKHLFGKVIVPPEVFDELCRIEFQKEELAKNLWIETAFLSDAALKNELIADLDAGEAEAIALAVELKADFLLIDEQKGRAAAENCGLKVTGILGVLIQAKNNNLIVAVKPLLDRLIYDANFWIHPVLVNQVLELVQES